MYPAQATSNPANPGTVPSEATISAAMTFGALRSFAGKFEGDGGGELAEFEVRREFS